MNSGASMPAEKARCAPRSSRTASEKAARRRASELRQAKKKAKRESVRTLYPRIRPGFDIVLVSRGKTPFVHCGAVLAEMTSALEELGVLVCAGKKRDKPAGPDRL